MSASPAPEAVKWRQHLTLQLPDAKPGCIWVHACSVGEVGSVAPLIKRLLAMGHAVHLTVVTATGHAHARRLLGDAITLSWLPWDLPGLMNRLVARLQPGLLLLTETEFWPGMLGACRRHGVDIVGINTRISDRSFPRYRATRTLWKRWLAPVSLFLAQSAVDGERLVAMGIQSERIRDVGNLKYAIRAPEVDAAALRAHLDPESSRPVLLIASTHEGEDQRLLAMLPAWRTIRPDLLVALVPRHPERFDQVAELVRLQGLRLKRWSEAEESNDRADVVLIDAMGVLGGLYTVADLVIIAGSLADIGGHNPLEAAICGRGVVTGPHVQNFREIMQEMQQAGGAIAASSDRELATAIERLLSHPDELKQLHGNAALFIRERAGVLERILDALEPWLARP